jgi:hypothetical protein
VTATEEAARSNNIIAKTLDITYGRRPIWISDQARIAIIIGFLTSFYRDARSCLKCLAIIQMFQRHERIRFSIESSSSLLETQLIINSQFWHYPLVDCLKLWREVNYFEFEIVQGDDSREGSCLHIINCTKTDYLPSCVSVAMNGSCTLWSVLIKWKGLRKIQFIRKACDCCWPDN